MERLRFHIPSLVSWGILKRVYAVQHSEKEKPMSTKKEQPKGNDMRLKNLLPKDLDKKVKNPDTGKMIKIKSALAYDKNTPAYKAAEFALKRK